MDGFNQPAAPVAATNTAPSEGEAFWVWAQDQVGQLFAQFLQNAGQYESVEAYSDALHQQAWLLTERIAKASYTNGRGRRGKKQFK